MNPSIEMHRATSRSRASDHVICSFVISDNWHWTFKLGIDKFEKLNNEHRFFKHDDNCVRAEDDGAGAEKLEGGRD